MTPCTSRATTIDSSPSKANSRSASSGTPGSRPSRAQAHVELGGVGDPELSPAVVAADRQLEADRQAQRVGGAASLGGRSDLAPGCDADAGRFDESPFGETVLGDRQRSMAGTDRQPSLERGHDLGRHVLQLVGDHRAPVRQPQRGSDVVVRAHDDSIRDRRGRAVGVGIEDGDPIAHRPRGEGEHPSELTAAEDPDDGRRQDRRTRGLGRCDVHPVECRGRGTRLPSRSCLASRCPRSATSSWSG